MSTATKFKIYLASDHAGFELKKALCDHLKSQSHHQVVELGCFSTQSYHYPESTIEMCRRIQSENQSLGIAICGSGIGVSMVANRFSKIRAARCVSLEDAKLSREHNNANVLCLGARVNSLEQSMQMVDLWLKTEFAGGRHSERIDLFDQAYGSDL